MRGNQKQSNHLVILVFAAASIAFAAFALYHLIPPGPYGLSGDFRVFYSASKLFWAGGNPYNLHALGIIEQQSHHYSHLRITSGAYVNPPILAALLWPFTLLPYWVAYTAFVVLGLILAGVVIWYLAKELGWRHRGVLVGVAALSWLELLGLTEGQVDTYLLAILLAGVFFCWRKQYLAAGLVMGLFWIKPDILWPAALFLGLVLLPHKRDFARYLTGFAGASLLCLAVGANLLPAWLHYLVGFSQHVGVQPDLAGLPGLLGAAPASLGLGAGLHSWVSLTIIALAILAMVALIWFIPKSAKWQNADRRLQILWAATFPLGIWLLASPYVHTNDDLLLLPLFLLIVGQDALLTQGRDALLGTLAILSIFLVWYAKLAPGVYELLLLVILLGCFWLARRHIQILQLAAGACLAAAITFPTVWSLHLAPVSATSITVLIVVITASWRYRSSTTLSLPSSLAPVETGETKLH